MLGVLDGSGSPGKPVQWLSATRRRCLKIVGALVLGDVSGIGTAFAAARPNQNIRNTLAAFVDTLIPRDGVNGSATDLRIDEMLWQLSQSSDQFHRLLRLGCQWLNQTGGPPFDELLPEQQTMIVAWMAQSDWNEIPRRFYELVRQTTAELYFSQPTAWHGLAMTRPPQPFGYQPPWP